MFRRQSGLSCRLPPPRVAFSRTWKATHSRAELHYRAKQSQVRNIPRGKRRTWKSEAVGRSDTFEQSKTSSGTYPAVSGDRETILDAVDGPQDATQVAVVPLNRAASPKDHQQHMEGIVVASPALGLVLLDTSLGRRLGHWSHSGVRSVLTLPSGDILTASADGFLHQLKPDLSGEQSQPLPTRGACQLYAGKDQSTLYSLQFGIGEGVVGLWKLNPTPALEGQIRLATPPQLATVDPEGKLWVVCQRGTVFKIDPERKLAEEMLPRLSGQSQAAAYLAPKLKPSGLDKLKDQPTR